VAKADPAPVFHSRKQEDRRPAARIPVAARAHGRGGGRVRRHVGHRHAGDIIEEIVGEIHDEFDEESKSIMQLDDHTYVFEGKVSLSDFCRALDVDPEDFDEVRGDSESLGGLLLEMFSRLPAVGERTSFGQFTFSIMSVDNKKIRRVKVVVLPEETGEKPAGPARKGNAH
jgi:Mg2+/Co2+ transporter CorC